jgi:tetratricopeptide (TPR) repeat protein
MKALRTAAALLVFVVCSLTAVRFVLPSLSCNREKAVANAATILRNRARSSYEQTLRARRMAAACARCLEVFPNDPEFMILLASNQHVLGQYEEAERNYRRALELNDRADAYAFLALLELDLGRIEEARRDLYHAALFDMSFVEFVSSPMREEIYAEVVKRHDRLRGNRPTS